MTSIDELKDISKGGYMLPKTEIERLRKLGDNLACIQADLRAITREEWASTTIVAACDLAADYVERATQAARHRIESIEIGRTAMEEIADVASH